MTEWHEELKEYLEGTGKTVSELAKESGIPYSSMTRLYRGSITDIGRVHKKRRRELYDFTGLEVLKSYLDDSDVSERSTGKGLDAEQIARDAREGKEAIDGVVERVTAGLSGGEKLKAGLLRVQRYTPDAKQRARGVAELLDVLAEEVHYYTHATSEERKALMAELKGDAGESYRYAAQLLNIVFDGGMESWMALTQPPARIRKIVGKGK
tara:strand:+ start:1087 stop:1716 length:630 start_codon:yes stop_codon:yes gene_type:complete